MAGGRQPKDATAVAFLLRIFRKAGLELLILGIDTTTLACSVALLDDEALLAEFTLNIRKTHSERLMPLIDALLKESSIEREQLQAVAVAAGPGSFTGIRIGVSTARALAQGLAIPAVGVSTLQALAEAVPSPGALICPLLDARRNELYSALYRREPAPPRSLELLIPPAAVELGPFTERLKRYGEPIIFVGEGLAAHGPALASALG
ncbi:MAG: tRNA (adenosine(37)-N6)-threonylcarbamoyltransferase complex dimerization subunit type 1 TsaB, partial [Dethiobacteria bacterium]